MNYRCDKTTSLGAGKHTSPPDIPSSSSSDLSFPSTADKYSDPTEYSHHKTHQPRCICSCSKPCRHRKSQVNHDSLITCARIGSTLLIGSHHGPSGSWVAFNKRDSIQA